jgi:hypothetical protein
MRADFALMSFNDLFDDRQPYPSAFVFTAAMQALERLQDFLKLLFLKPDAVIFYFDGNHLAFASP